MVDIHWPVAWTCVPCGARFEASGPGKENTPDTCNVCDGEEWSAVYDEDFFRQKVKSKKVEKEFDYEYKVRIVKNYNSEEFNVIFYDDEERSLMDLFTKLGFEDAIMGRRHFDTGYGFGDKPFRDWFVPTIEEQYKRGWFEQNQLSEEEE